MVLIVYLQQHPTRCYVSNINQVPNPHTPFLNIDIYISLQCRLSTITLSISKAKFCMHFYVFRNKYSGFIKGIKILWRLDCQERIFFHGDSSSFLMYRPFHLPSIDLSDFSRRGKVIQHSPCSCYTSLLVHIAAYFQYELNIANVCVSTHNA